MYRLMFGMSVNERAGVLEFLREIELVGCEYIEKDIYYKELTSVTMEIGQFKICSVGWQAIDSGEPMLQL